MAEQVRRSADGAYVNVRERNMEGKHCYEELMLKNYRHFVIPAFKVSYVLRESKASFPFFFLVQ